ncbi:MAG TPA: VOC family protein [candidate division Zixibacteria bacterium]|nr:VOC family protein [candidate division Zixibacteria bacterium]
MTEGIMKIRRVYFQVKVNDLIRAKDFYQKTFKFEVAFFEGVELGWCEMQLPGEARLGLNLRLPGDDKPLSWGILTIDVENLEETREYLLEIGLEPTEIYDNPNNVSYFNVKDSEGNSIQIVGDPRIKTL